MTTHVRYSPAYIKEMRNFVRDALNENPKVNFSVVLTKWEDRYGVNESGVHKSRTRRTLSEAYDKERRNLYRRLLGRK